MWFVSWLSCTSANWDRVEGRDTEPVLRTSWGTTKGGGDFDSPDCVTEGSSDAWVGVWDGTDNCELQGPTIGKDEGLALVVGEPVVAGPPTWAFGALRVRSEFTNGSGVQAKYADIAVQAYDIADGYTLADTETISTDVINDSVAPFTEALNTYNFDEPMDIKVVYDGDNYHVFVLATTAGDATVAGFNHEYGSNLVNWDGMLFKVRFDPANEQFNERSWVYQFGTDQEDAAQGLAIQGESVVVTGRFKENTGDLVCASGSPDAAYDDLFVLYMEVVSSSESKPRLSAGQPDAKTSVYGGCAEGDVGSAAAIDADQVAVVGTRLGGTDHAALDPDEDGVLLTFDIVSDLGGSPNLKKLQPSLIYGISGDGFTDDVDRPAAAMFSTSRLHIVGFTLSDLDGSGAPGSQEGFYVDLADSVL
jgi:hypothetical protein